MLPIEQCYGVVTVLKEKEWKFLILRLDTKDDHWSFPKGHHEGEETAKETAIRELKEETAITEIEFLDFPLIHEEYEIIHHGVTKLKVNEYFVGLTKEINVTIQKDEVFEYMWATYEEAMGKFNYKTRKEVLAQAKKYLDEYESRK